MVVFSPYTGEDQEMTHTLEMVARDVRPACV